MAPANTRSQGGPSSQQQPSPAPKETIKVQENEPEEEEEESDSPKGKERELTIDDKLRILMTELQAVKRENARLARQQRSSTLPLFGANQSRENTVPPPAYYGMPKVKGYKPTPPKPYDGTTDVEGFLVQARLHLKLFENSLREDYQKLLAIAQLLAGRVLQ
ncbi:hypothetical protein DL768_010008 [Monosporascus sp. mg162]|nr:hypothetical protein DL768_010008 [Monosporascus sp. mg162]